MIQLKRFILTALSQLGCNSWDESLLVRVLICARIFFSNLPPFTKNNPRDFPAAAVQTKEFLQNNDIKVPFDLDEPTTQNAMQQIGSRIKSLHDFGQLYSMLINPFAVYPNLPSSVNTDEALLLTDKVIKNSQALFAHRNLPYSSSNSNKQPSEELTQHTKLIDNIRISPNIPSKADETIKGIVNASKRTGYEETLHLYSLVFTRNINTWDDACETEKRLNKLSGKTKNSYIALFNKISHAAQTIDPLELIKKLLYDGINDESGLETSYISTQIFKYGSKETRLFIDPSPDFIRKCVTEQYNCIIALSNTDLTEIYRRHFENAKGISFCNVDSLPPITKPCCMVWFSTGREWAVRKDMSEQKRLSNEEFALRKLTVFHCVPENSIVLMVVQDTVLNNHKNQLHEAWKSNNLQLYGILLLPSFTFKKTQPFVKTLLLLESNSQQNFTHSVEILKMVHDPTQTEIAQIQHEHLFFPYKEFVNDSRNVRTLFSEEKKKLIRKVPYRTRNTGESTCFIDEIKDRLHWSPIEGNRARNNPSVMKLSYNPLSDEKINPKEIRPNKEDLKTYQSEAPADCSVSIREKQLRMLHEKVNSKIESMLYSDPYKSLIQADLRSIITDKDHTPSLKALSFLFQDALQEQHPHKFNKALCQEMFSVNHNMLSSIVPDTDCSEAVYRKAITESYPSKIKICPACKSTNIKSASECIVCGQSLSDEKSIINDKLFHQLFVQILMILRIASDNGFSVNIKPVRDLEEEYASRNRGTPEQQQARNALVMKAYTDNQEQKISEMMFASESHAKISLDEMAKRIYCMLRYFYPCEKEEIRALTWGDYNQIKNLGLHTLTIYKSIDKKNCIRFYAETGKQLKFRILPIAPLLATLFEDYISMLKRADPNACDPDRPLIQLKSSNGNLCNISDKQASTCEVHLDKVSGRNEMKQEKTLPGKNGPKETDLSRKRGLLFDSNWKYRVKEVGLTDGESAYLRGVVADTTYDVHYCDYANPFILLMMSLKINRWINQLLLSLEKETNTIIHGHLQQLNYYRITNPDEVINLTIKGNLYGIKATITYTTETKGKSA